MAAQAVAVKYAFIIGDIMKAHIIENSVIVNTIEIESIEFAQELFENAIDASVGGSIGDRFEQGLIVPKNTSAEQSLAIRHDRNLKLALSDWTQLSDAPVNKVLWAAYRQALRDIPQQAGFPTSIDWPVAP